MDLKRENGFGKTLVENWKWKAVLITTNSMVHGLIISRQVNCHTKQIFKKVKNMGNGIISIKMVQITEKGIIKTTCVRVCGKRGMKMERL